MANRLKEIKAVASLCRQELNNITINYPQTRNPRCPTVQTRLDGLVGLFGFGPEWQCRGELRLASQCGAVSAEHEGDGAQDNGDQPQERGRPLRVQRVIHLGSEQGEARAEKRSDDCVGGKGGGGNEEVGVDDVVEEGEEDPNGSEAEATASGHWGPVVDAGIRRPAEPEERRSEKGCRPHRLL